MGYTTYSAVGVPSALFTGVGLYMLLTGTPTFPTRALAAGVDGTSSAHICTHTHIEHRQGRAIQCRCFSRRNESVFLGRSRYRPLLGTKRTRCGLVRQTERLHVFLGHAELTFGNIEHTGVSSLLVLLFLVAVCAHREFVPRISSGLSIPSGAAYENLS